MFNKERFDGTYIRNINFFTQITPYVKPARTDSVIVFEQEYNTEKTLGFMQWKNVSFNQIFLYAALRAITIMPKMNRFISGLRYYQRNRIMFTFGNSASDDVTMTFSPLLTFENFCQKINNNALQEKTQNPKIEKILSIIQKLPRFLIKFLIWGVKFLDYHNALPVSFAKNLPYFSTMIITNTDANAVYYHNFDIGTCGMYCTIANNKKINFTFDNRITDPAYCAQFLNLLRDFTENPEKLETPPEWTTEQFVKLGLSEKELNDI